MNESKRIADLDEDTRRLYCMYDYHYFLERNIHQREYERTSIDQIHKAHQTTCEKLRKMLKENSRQAFYHIDGKIRNLHTSGQLPSRLELSQGGSGTVMNFEGEGEAWAYFETWKKIEKVRILKRRIWDMIIKTGALLGFLLTIIKLVEVLGG